MARPLSTHRSPVLDPSPGYLDPSKKRTMRRTRCYEDPLGKIEHSRDFRGFLIGWVESTLQLYQLHPIRTQHRVSHRYEPKTRLVSSFCRVVEPIRVFQRQRLAPMLIVGGTKLIETSVQVAADPRTRGNVPRTLHENAVTKDVPPASMCSMRSTCTFLLPNTPRRSRRCVASSRRATFMKEPSSSAVHVAFSCRKHRQLTVQGSNRSCCDRAVTEGCNCAVGVHLGCESVFAYGQRFHSIPPRALEIVSHFRRLCRHRGCLPPRYSMPQRNEVVQNGHSPSDVILPLQLCRSSSLTGGPRDR